MSTRESLRLDDERMGVGRRAAYALAIWPTDAISRATLRALLPKGEMRDATASRHAHQRANGGTGRVNVVSRKLQTRLWEFEDAGLIQRGEKFIRIIDRRTLLDRALEGISDPTHRAFLAIERASQVIDQQLRQERDKRLREIREAELEFIRSLMTPEHVRGDNRSGAGSVRFIPRKQPR